MKKILFLLLALFTVSSAIAQETKPEIKTRIDVIRNESVAGANTKTRIANAYQELADGMISIYPITASGTDTYTGSLQGLDAYSGRIVFVVFPNNNTGAATMNIGGIGAANIQKYDAGWTALGANDIVAGKLYRLYHDGTRFQIQLEQTLDSDLTTIAGLTPTTDNFIQAKSSAWASRTLAQVRADLSYEDRFGIACSDLVTTLTTGTSKAYFRAPCAMTVTEVRASLINAQSSGTVLTIDINEANTTILSTKLTIDNSEKTSTTAATPYVISDSAIADDAEITVDFDALGVGGLGVIVWIIGTCN